MPDELPHCGCELHYQYSACYYFLISFVACGFSVPDFPDVLTWGVGVCTTESPNTSDNLVPVDFVVEALERFRAFGDAHYYCDDNVGHPVL